MVGIFDFDKFGFGFILKCLAHVLVFVGVVAGCQGLVSRDQFSQGEIIGQAQNLAIAPLISAVAVLVVFPFGLFPGLLDLILGLPDSILLLLVCRIRGGRPGSGLWVGRS